MGKTIQFVETASKKVIQGGKDEVVVKNGNLRITKEENTLTVVHFGTVILEMRLGVYGNITELVNRWHIQSNTDANYIGTVLSLFHNSNYRTGYRPVNGGGYFETKIGDEWVPVQGEE